MAGKEARNNPGMCPVKGQPSGLCSRTRTRNQFSNLSLSNTRTTPYYQMLVNHPTFHLSFYVLRRNPQGRLRSYKLLNRTVSCELVGDFISSYPSTSRDPIESHYVRGKDIIQRRLALLYQYRRCFDSLKGFQSLPSMLAYSNIFFWPTNRLNFIYTCQDSIYLSLKTVAYFHREKLSLLPKYCP